MASVLHVVSYYPPDRLGGVGEVVATLHRGLLRRGHRSWVATSGDSQDDKTVLRVAQSPAGFVLRSTRALALARNADVIHVHHGEALGLLVALQLARIETPVLLTLHVNIAEMAKGSRPYRIGAHRLGVWSTREAVAQAAVMSLREQMDRAAIALADRLSFISRSAAIETLGQEAAATATIIYNGIAADRALDTSAHAPAELLFVGTASTRKRVESLPLILRAVRVHRPSATLRIVGFNAEDVPQLVALAEQLGLRDAIRFEGPMRSAEIPAYYRSAQVLLVPSSYEGLPMVILEAFAQGLPCVATRVSGHPEAVVDGVNGKLVPVDDPDAMARAALEILSLSNEARRAMSDAARHTVAAKFDANRQVDEYLALYESLRR